MALIQRIVLPKGWSHEAVDSFNSALHDFSSRPGVEGVPTETRDEAERLAGLRSLHARRAELLQPGGVVDGLFRAKIGVALSTLRSLWIASDQVTRGFFASRRELERLAKQVADVKTEQPPATE